MQKYYKALVIDDDPNQALPLQISLQETMALEDIDGRVDAVSKPQEILACAGSAREEDIIIVDYRLFDDFGYLQTEVPENFPYDNGEELAKDLLDRGFAGHIVILSGDGAFIEKKRHGGFLGIGANKDPRLTYLLKGELDIPEQITAIMRQAGA